MLEFNHVTKIYDSNIVAVNDVSFTIKDGEFVFLIGASGSGKTTVIKMLIRDEVPTSGSVYFHERDITKISRSRVYKVRREIGVIFQDYKLIQDKTAYENVAFAMEVAGKKNKEIKETIPYVLDIVGLAHRASSFPRQLSGGEQQRIAIARAIANSPKILIADEPTGNLDPSSAWDIVQILNKINNWGTTVIMSTHGTDIVNSLNKRVIQMEGGKIIRDDNKGQYELAAKKEFEKKMNDNAEEVVGKKEKKKIKISMAPVEETSVAEAVEDTLHPKQKRGIFRLFSRKTETTEPVNVLAGILGEKTENTMQ
jgi:cell division transport system ATP-binding protein